MTRLLPVVLLLLSLGLLSPTVQAQENRLLRWERYDVDIAIQPDGQFRVCETQVINFVQGTFTTGFAVIPLDRVVAIEAIELREPGQVYQPSTSRQPYTFRTETEGGQRRIDWYFPPTSGRSRTFELCYTVIGGLRIHDWGDQLWWKAVPGDRPYTVGDSTITVRLPAPVAPTELIPRTFADGVTATIVDGQTVRYQAGRVPADQEVEIGLQFPHGLVTASPPPWQVAVEAAEAAQARLEPYRALSNLALGSLALLILVGGGIGLYVLWSTRGRDLPVGRMAEYLREPPDDAPPAVVGTLLDERADVKDVVATLPWLASRGVITITETQSGGVLGIGASRDLRLERQTTAVALEPYEQAILQALFGGSTAVQLSQLRGIFLAQLPGIQRLLYDAVVERGYFPSRPDSVRTRYALFGAGLIVLAIVTGAILIPLVVGFAAAIVLPPVALALVGLLLIAVGQVMPRRTRAGALAAAKWRAFGRYLDGVERYEQLTQAHRLFERYLPYAIIFGVERHWVREFAAAGAPAPRWYHSPVYLPHPHGGWGRTWPGGGRGEVAGAPIGDAGAGGGDLQSMSDSMLGSLQGVSDGLLSMVDSASQVFHTPPAPPAGGGTNWRGGGGGWGGGGRGGGGGGGGGGSRGFG